MKQVLEVGMFQNFPDVLSVREVQGALRIGRAAVYKLLASGDLGCFKLGNTYKIPKDALIAYMNRQMGVAQKGGIGDDRELTN